ncbi:hypothetical protein [Staphylococcus hominis]|uniref:hypothetical protein n=1 Tax=Staphylococcus hominis TaxID=1290 RepID=UPI001F58661B|nr:hypothetical protein [Staphylococcus hominis]MCI2931428.1 hypothetical protein [Staphylococcus hominis]
MTLNNHFAYTFEERPTPKLWLCKPDGTRIERIADFSKLGGTFKFTNVNTLHFDLPLQVFSEDTKQIERNKVVDLVKNKYLIDYRYNGYRDIFVIDDIKKSANNSDFITLNLDSRASELNKKAANEIELLGSTIPQMMNKILSIYAPLWKLGHVDGKIIDVKRELTGSNTTVNALIDNICSLFDAVAIYNNIDRTINFYHKDNVGTNRGLRVRENSYLKSFEDQFISKDIVTRLYPFGQSGLTIQSVNPAGSSYIEDFSYFMSPFKRDNNRNVLQHSDYMSDELCHALLDYQEFYASKKDQAGELSKRYSEILKEHSQEDFRLNQLSATLQRLNERVELIKPKSEYIDLGTKIKNFKITVPKSSYYLIMIRNDGSLARIKFNNEQYNIPSGEWLYIKLKTGKFNDATKFEKQLEYPLEILSANANLRVIYTRSSEGDYEEEDIKKIEEKYNLEKYKTLVKDQEKVVASIERRLKAFEDQRASVTRSMNAKNFLSEKLYNERELYVFESVWTEENHTDAQELYDDAVKQMKEQKKINRTITVDLVNFIQSLDHKDDWDKLNVGDKVIFQNKIFNTKIKAYITEMQLDFETNQVKITISDIFDYKDLDTIIAEKLAQTTSTSSQVDFHKQQIREQTGRITDMTRLIEGEWDANKKRVMAGNETVDIGSHGVKVISKDNPNEFVIMVGGVIAMTRDNGETFKTGITPEGINAEMLIGKMIVGETLTFENESGTVKFDKDGLYVNSKNFHLVSNDGEENYFDKLKREMSENAKQQTDRMLEEYKKEVSQTISEATDVRNIVDNAADILQAAFADGVITDVEKRLISETLAQLEKENREFEDKINLALNHPYITEEDTIELNNSIIEYSSMYETLIISINESVSDKMITPQESEEINQNIVNFREEIKDILSLVEEVIERTKNAQLQATLEEAKDYTTRVRDDIKDELNDLNKSFKSLNSTVEESLKDNIFDAAELEAIKTVVLVTKSEYQDITNRYSSMAVNTDLNSESKSDLTKAYKTLDTSFNDFVKYIDNMTMDRIADESEKANYKTKYDTLQKNLSDYMKKYDNCILEISKKYSNDAADKVLGDFTAIATELQNDFQDVKDNWVEFKQTTLESFKDGIVTEAEKARLRVQLDMLDRESMDIEERYKSLLANQYTDTNIKNRLAASRSPYLSAHASLRQAIEQIIADGQVDESEKTLANNSLNTYNTTLTAYSKAIQEALNTLSQIISSDVASKKVEEFNGVITTISSDVDTIKKQRDGSVITYYYSGVPTLSNDPAKSWTTNELKDLHIKDMYLDTKSGYAYTFTKSGTSYSWKPLTDQVIVSSLKQAKNAQDTADNKRRVFVTQPTPPYDQGDMWTQGSQGDIFVCGTSRTTGSFVSSDWVKASKYTDDTVAKQAAKDLKDYKVKMTKDFKDLNDGVSTFKAEVVKDFKDGIVTEAEKTRLRVQLDILDRESQDIEERYNSIFNSQYADTQVKATISNARSTYNNSLTKLRNTIQTVIEDGKVTPTEKTTANQTLATYNNALTGYSTAIQEALNSMSKVIAQKEATNQVNQFNEVINNINTNITDIQKQVDGAIETFYYSGVPTLKNIPASDWKTTKKLEAHLGDLYLDTATGIAYRFLKKGTTSSPTYYWSAISDQIITDALNRAKTAQDTADGKRRVFVNTPVPPYDTGDMWTQGVSGDILVCQTPKAKGGIYSINDWVKASKYTDDTVANSAVQQLNEYKRTNNLDVANLKKKTSDFEKTVVNAFDDRVVSISEASAIKGQLTLLNHEKDRLTRQYENIIGNSNLVGAEKTKLFTAYSNMNTKLSDLSTTINSAIVDNKIVDAESKSVTSKFELYKTSVNEYQFAFDNALNSIIREIASSQAKDRLDEWKRTEFSTDSDGIIERVAGAKFDSKWTDTWRNTVNPAIQQVSNITYGSENLLLNSESRNDGANTTTHSFIRYYLTHPLEIGKTYTLKADVVTTDERQSGQTSVYPYNPRGIRDTVDIKDGKIIYTFTAQVESTEFLIYKDVVGQSDVDLNVTIEKAILVEGNKVTGWSPAPEDTSTALQEYNTRISSAETFIEKNKDKISQIATKTDVDASLSKVATYETQYSVSSGSNYQIPLQEYNGSFFTDNYTYEVVAKNNSLSSNNVATAIFVSKGSNNGYELVELDNMSKTGANPKFVLDSKGRPSISTFSPQSATQDISVIYTKYLGSASAINTTKSLIEQTASSIELQVKKLTAETEYNNILLNSDFSSGWEGWIYVDPQFSIVDKNTFGYTRFDTLENKTKKYNTIKMAYNKNTNYPSVFSNFISVGKGQEVAIGEDLTLSCYAYIPSSSKGQLTGNVYIEINGYFDKDQNKNPSLAKHYINTEDFEYDKWFRMTATTTIPATIPDGRKMNYIRAGLRYSAKTQSVNDKAIFYYALPQLERGSKPTEWSLSRLDVFSTEQMAAKIALNPQSVDIIARNIDFNTDAMRIYNSNGTLNISGDTLTISNNNSSNEVIINPNGFTLKKDGVVKFKNGLDTSDYNVQAYEPQFSSWNDLKATHSAASSKYNYVRHIEPGMNGYYTVNTGVYNFAAQYKQLVESSGKKNARVNRYTYLYNKRYLKVQMSALSQGKSKLYIRFLSTTGGTLFHEEVVSSTSTTFPDVTIDLQAKLGYPPNNKPDFFEVQAGIAYGEDNSIDGFFRIRRMALTDTPNAEV